MLKLPHTYLDSMMPSAEKLEAFLSSQFQRHSSFGSNLLTLAELVARTSVPQLPSLGVAVDNYPKLSAWCQRLIKRHSWQNSIAQRK